MDSRQFRNTLGHFASGVTVITTKHGDELIGLTANAFSSLSLDPPLILVCIDKKSSSIKAFQQGEPFAVNILSEKQVEDCWRFAKKGKDKYEGCAYDLSEDGILLLQNNLATLKCTVAEVLEGGDHYIITGRVKQAAYDDTENPLLFFRGKVRLLSEQAVTQ